MKRKILFVIEVFLCCSLFAFILPGDAHLQAIMDAAREGCPVSIERSKTINTKYGKLKTADNRYVAYYPSGNIRLIYLDKATKIKIKNQTYLINSFETESSLVFNNIDVPVEFHENGNIKHFICESSVKIPKYKCSTLESSYMEFDEDENLIYFVPVGKFKIKVNKSEFLIDSVSFDKAPIELYSNGNIKTLTVQLKSRFEGVRTDFPKTAEDPVVSFYESGEIEGIEVSRNNFKIFINDDWQEVSGIHFYENGSCKSMDLYPLQETTILWEGEEKNFLQKNILYKPDGNLSAIVGAFDYKIIKQSLDFTFMNKCYLIYKDNVLSQIVQKTNDEYPEFMSFNEKDNTPLSYVMVNLEDYSKYRIIEFDKNEK